MHPMGNLLGYASSRPPELVADADGAPHATTPPMPRRHPSRVPHERPSRTQASAKTTRPPGACGARRTSSALMDPALARSTI